MENLAGLLSEGLNMGGKEIDSQDPDPRTTITSLQLAYEKQKGSNFFARFSAEIRNKIYECLLIAHEIITPDHRLLGHVVFMADRRYRFGDYGIGDKLAAGLHGAVVRTCRACVYETYPILYGQNRFLFGRYQEFDYFKLGGLMLKPYSCQNSCELVPSKPFGTVLVAGTEGRLSLIRHVSLNMTINGSECREPVVILDGVHYREAGECATANFMECWSKLAKWYGPEALPALEHLRLDFTHSEIAEEDLLNLQEYIAETRSLSGGFMKLTRLRKVTFKGLEYKPLLKELQRCFRPEVEICVELGGAEERCKISPKA